MKKSKSQSNVNSNLNPDRDLFKVIVCAVALCIIMAILLYMYNALVPSKIAELEEKGKMDNVVWIIQYGSHLPPVVLIAVLLSVFYRNKNEYVRIYTQRNMAKISGGVAVFTYVVMLPYVIFMSKSEADGDAVTLIDRTITWFAAQIIPFMILIAYHSVRASTEAKELYENEK